MAVKICTAGPPSFSVLPNFFTVSRAGLGHVFEELAEQGCKI